MVSYTLAYKDYLQSMSVGLRTLLDGQELANVTIAIEGKILKAHQVILSIYSPLFKSLFIANPCQHPVFYMHELKYSIMKDLLQFMYQGHVEIQQDDVPVFFQTAKALQIKGLDVSAPSQPKTEHFDEDDDYSSTNKRKDKEFATNESSSNKKRPMGKTHKGGKEDGDHENDTKEVKRSKVEEKFGEVKEVNKASSSFSRSRKSDMEHTNSNTKDIGHFEDVIDLEDDEEEEDADLVNGPVDDSIVEENLLKLLPDHVPNPESRRIETDVTEIWRMNVHTGLLYRGYKYSKRYQSTTHVTWRCTFRTKTACPAGMNTTYDNYVAYHNLHNHEPADQFKLTPDANLVAAKYFLISKADFEYKKNQLK